MIVIELTAAVDSSGTLQTFYLSTDRFVTEPTDTPANTAFLPILVDPGSIGLHAFSDGQTGGATNLEMGEIVAANADGSLDSWVNYSFDGRPAVIRCYNGGAYPAAATTLMTGTVQGIELSWKQATIMLRDKQWKLQLPLITNRYGGTNSLPNGIDGTASDIKGQPKPRLYGVVANATPVCVNTSLLIFQMNDGAINAVTGVYDSGSAVPFNADYATNALLQSATTPAGKYDTCLAEGLFRMGTSPSGVITFDANTTTQTTGQILSKIARDMGLTASEVSSTDISAMDTANSSAAGIYVNDVSTTGQNAMDQVAATMSAWYGFDSSGTLRIGQLAEPSASPVVTLYDYDIGDTIERRPLKDGGVPVYRVVANYAKNYTVQTSGVAGSVAASRRYLLGLPSRSEKSEDISVRTQWLMASERVVDTLFATNTAAASEASRLLGLYKKVRSLFDVPVDISILVNNSLKLMDTVGVQIGRFEMDAGKNFRVLGIRLDLAKNQATLTLWG